MPPLKSLMAPRARGSRKFLGAKTPEPFADGHGDAQAPSPPRPRFRLRRRNAGPQREAPTQHFLASVAAADVPIPSIEEPRPMDDEDMLATPQPMILSSSASSSSISLSSSASASASASGFLGLPQPSFRDGASCPRTPVPRAVPSLSPKRFPDWSVDQAYSSLESSSECDSSRPSTAQSTQTSASLFSRYSANSDGLSLFSLDPEDLGAVPPIEDPDKTIKARPIAQSRSAVATGRSRKAPWTRPMSQHLWSTYMMYLQDPHVTPFRVSKTGIPPPGVCMRVAREAKRSWKGSRAQTKTETKGGDNATPTVESSSSSAAAAAGAFVMWPHSCAATRAQLRSLCQLSAGTSARNHPYLTQRSTLFGRTTATRNRNRRSTPSVSLQAFSGSDMALSLAVSTCESMQPRGPLAQLTASGFGPGVVGLEPLPIPLTTAIEVDAAPHQPAPAPPPSQVHHFTTIIPSISTLVSEEPIARLGSPFMAKSYGPSSSDPIPDVMAGAAALEPRRMSYAGETTMRRSLRSPAKLSSSRPNTQKRRSRQTPLLDPRRKRPSLSLDIWKAPPSSAPEASSSAAAPQLLSQAPLPLAAPTSFPQFAPTSHPNPALVAPRPDIQQLFHAPHIQPVPGDVSASASSSASISASHAPDSLAAPTDIPRRLGSPFAAAMSSFSFPNRSSSISAFDFGVIRRPFTTTTTTTTTTGATTNTTTNTNTNTTATDDNTTPTKPSSLRSRLAYIDERLKDFRRLSPTRRRSRSPL